MLAVAQESSEVEDLAVPSSYMQIIFEIDKGDE
jgi:hypothetical protein